MSSLLSAITGDDSGGTLISIDHPNNIIDLLNGTTAGLIRLVANDNGAFQIVPDSSGFVATNYWLRLFHTDGTTLRLGIRYNGVIDSDVATGTAPFELDSTTLVTNLNSDLLDGLHLQSGGTGSVVATGGAATLTDKTLTTPTIAATGWANANHDHGAANAGGAIVAAAIPNNAITTARIADGAVTAAKLSTGFPRCRVTNSANWTSTTSGTFTLTFDTESYDNDTMHSTSTNTSRITFTTAGTYGVRGQVVFSDHYSGNLLGAWIRLNGTTILAGWQQQSGAATANDLIVSLGLPGYPFSAADYVELLYSVDNVINITVLASGGQQQTTNTIFEAALVGV